MKLKDGRICFVEDRGTLRSIAKGGDHAEELKIPGWQGLFECNTVYPGRSRGHLDRHPRWRRVQVRQGDEYPVFAGEWAEQWNCDQFRRG
jgi:hypothetical protein